MAARMSSRVHNLFIVRKRRCLKGPRLSKNMIRVLRRNSARFLGSAEWRPVNIQWPACRLFSDGSMNKPSEYPKQKLFQHLYDRIKLFGPITLAVYMKEVLTNSVHGYYMGKDVFGEAGDFITSPEISQMFGEMVAIWIVNEYMKISRDPFQLVELGPGRGTLMKDVLRVFGQLKLADKVSVHLVEVSQGLSDLQAKNLCSRVEESDPEQKAPYYKKGTTENGIDVFWYRSVQDVPRKFSVFLANEFFDALPIHKFQKTAEGWREVLVDIVEDSNEERFRYVLSKYLTPATVFISEDEQRSHVEISPMSLTIMEYVSKLLRAKGGFGLIIDYGHNGEKTDTFRAFQRHQQSDPLLRPGTMDLTADVDFSALRRVATKDDSLITFGPITQQLFLKQMGIDVRLAQLLRTVTEDEKKQLISGYNMLMNEGQMGTCFKAFSFFPAVLRDLLKKLPLAGF